jgi:aminoglycoside phosphotransferase (APT) family kinase protein
MSSEAQPGAGRADRRVSAIDGERLRAALTSWLAEAFGGEVSVSAPRRLSGGAVQENWSLDVEVREGEQRGAHALVLRTDAPSRMSASLSREQEFAVLQAACTACVNVPEPLFLCADDSVLGRSFFVMRRAPGNAAGHRLVKDPSLDGEALAGRLGEELGRLHAIRPPFPGLEQLPEPDMAPALFRVQTYRGHLDDLGAPRPALEWALRWLERFAPHDETLVLCHGDFRTGNYLVHDGDLSGILDWEFAGWGHPDEDLGWFCARCWRFGRDEREAGGIAARESLFRGYERSAGVSVDRQQIAYWEVMATVRWAVLALQQGHRHLSGEERSLELALTGRMVPEMELDALNQVERQLEARARSSAGRRPAVPQS